MKNRLRTVLMGLIFIFAAAGFAAELTCVTFDPPVEDAPHRIYEVEGVRLRSTVGPIHSASYTTASGAVVRGIGLHDRLEIELPSATREARIEFLPTDVRVHITWGYAERTRTGSSAETMSTTWTASDEVVSVPLCCRVDSIVLEVPMDGAILVRVCYAPNL